MSSSSFDAADFVKGELRSIESRRLNAATCERYRYAIADYRGKKCQVADFYDSQGRPIAQKLRFADKSFTWIGSAKKASLFGQQLWAPGRRVCVTEGEIDAMALAQVQGLRWPVVSVKNGAQGAKKDLAAQIEWLEAFEEVVLCFDNDEAGQKAIEECAPLFSPGKCRIMRLPLKDAGAMLEAGRADEMVKAVWNAAPYRPDGIVAGVDLVERVLVPPPPSIDYPWQGLTEKLRGLRTGEITLLCGGTGGGKSQVTREVAFHLHNRGEKVAVIALEESVTRAALAQVALQMGKRLQEPSVRAEVGDDAIRAAAEKALANVYFYEHFGSVGGDVLIPKIRFLAKSMDVRWVILDHISIMISGSATDGDERKRIDELMTKLRTAVEELGVGLLVVSHLRKASGTPHEEGGRISLDDLRGSGAIKQLSDNIIALERDQQADDDKVKNTTTCRVLKCRLFGETGVAGWLLYDRETGRLRETDAPDKPEVVDDGEDGF